ncbi:MAG: hypothetical protein ACXWJW_12205 [Xanthobacteraceae bacterium]
MTAMYRADQIGSLIRPARLLDARDACKAGRIDRDALSAVEDDCVLEVLQLQKNTHGAMYESLAYFVQTPFPRSVGSA